MMISEPPRGVRSPHGRRAEARLYKNRRKRRCGRCRMGCSTAALPLAAAADREIGPQFLDVCLIVQRLHRRWSLGNIGLLPDLGLFCWAGPNGQRLACLFAVVDTYGEA